jgi:hypothetical protein
MEKKVFLLMAAFLMTVVCSCGGGGAGPISYFTGLYTAIENALPKSSSSGRKSFRQTEALQSDSNKV